MPKGIQGFQKGNELGRSNSMQAIQIRMRKELTDRVAKEIHPIIDGKIDLAKGIHVIIARKFESRKVGYGKKAHYESHRTGPFEVIERASDVRKLLSLAQPEEGSGDTYYKIVTQKPDNMAGSYLLDQAMGKAKETLEVEGGVNMNIDKAIILQIGKVYGKEQITNGKYTGNGQAGI